MNDSQSASPVSAYLRSLDNELARVSEPVASQVRDGVAEELRSLSPEVALERMKQLGDPAHIAYEAQRDSADLNNSPAAAGRSRAYVIVTAVLVAFGGLVVPIVGWIAGIILLWLGKAWKPFQKIVATAVPLLVIVVGGVWGWFMPTTSTANQSPSSRGSGFDAPQMEDFTIANALPALTWWHVVLIVLAVNVVIAIWILRTGLKHSSPARE
ncbi:hypothetical protein [Cryobacterium sp. PH31-O1]|uniref:hypothetical protein n=1 Tax=Cryobacterium sp. PH31-O1 TaxID=3046306 RepID=UPI0024BA1A6A|nr:hypothetical protein [Cryobacterium sp. PH31-O1]MDJ0336640.1 hypothetical protein [Cryobacterium sp. PH31-O1]